MSRSVQLTAYKYGMQLAARDAGYANLDVFTKQAAAVPGALIGAGVGLGLGAGVGAMADPEHRLRGAATGAGLGGLAGAGIGGAAGHFIGQSGKAVAKAAPKVEQAAAKTEQAAAKPAAAHAPEIPQGPSASDLGYSQQTADGLSPETRALIMKMRGQGARDVAQIGPATAPPSIKGLVPQAPVGPPSLSGVKAAPNMAAPPKITGGAKPNTARHQTQVGAPSSPMAPPIDAARYQGEARAAARANFDVPGSTEHIRALNPRMEATPSMILPDSGVRPSVPKGIPVRSGGTPVYSPDPRTGQPIFMGKRNT